MLTMAIKHSIHNTLHVCCHREEEDRYIGKVFTSSFYLDCFYSFSVNNQAKRENYSETYPEDSIQRILSMFFQDNSAQNIFNVLMQIFAPEIQL